MKARRGYYAPRHLTSADEEAKEEISQALFSRDDMRDIPVDVHTQFFKPTDDEAQLSVITRIDVRKLSSHASGEPRWWLAPTTDALQDGLPIT